MDIVVTIPKRDSDIWEQEVEKIKAGEMKVWSINQKPSKLQVGERVYFVCKGRIVASMKLMEIKENNSFVCSTTRREWSGRYQLFLGQYQEEEIDIQVKGFQGFRYKWW